MPGMVGTAFRLWADTRFAVEIGLANSCKLQQDNSKICRVLALCRHGM